MNTFRNRINFATAPSELVGKESVAAIARLLGVNRATLYTHVPKLQDRRHTALPLPEAHRNDQSR